MDEETRQILIQLYGDKTCERCGQPLLDGSDVNFVVTQDIDAYEYDPKTGSVNGMMHYEAHGEPHYSHGRHAVESKTFRYSGIWF